MDVLFLKILNMSIAASWLIIVAVILRLVLKNSPKWVTVLLWSIVAIRLICPVTIENPFSLIPGSVGNGELVSKWTDDYIGDIDIYYPNSAHYDAAIGAGRAPVSDGEGGYYVVTKHDQLGEPDTIENTVIPVLSIVWLAGIGTMFLYAAISYFQLRKRVGASILFHDRIWLCDDIQTPFILGCFKPKIYIPSGTDEVQLPYIIAHESAHLKRRDHWWKTLGYFVLTIHWFNPLVWIAYILLCRDIELACDEKVIRELNKDESISYSEALLSCSINRRTVMICPLAFGEIGVKERVKRVLNYKKPAFWIIVAALLSCIVMAVCFLTNPAENGYADEETGYLSFENGVIEIIKNDSTISTVGGVDKPQRTDTAVETELDTAISSAIMEHNNNKFYKGVFACESHTVLATETGKSANSEEIETLTVYALALYEEYNFSEEGIQNISGACNPVALTFLVTENGYELSEYWEPGDGSQYSDDIRKKFPASILDKVWNSQNYVDAMTAETKQKALEFSVQKGDFKKLVNRLLTTICSESTTSSNPGDYIQASRTEYDELLSYGESTLKFCFTEFLAGGQTDLRGQIMACVCRDIMISMGDDYLSDVKNIYTAQDWFDHFKEDTENMKDQISPEDLEKYHPASWLLLQMINE